MPFCKEDLIRMRQVVVVSLIGGTLLTLYTCPGCSNSLRHFITISSLSALSWFILWAGNSALGRFLDGKLPWTTQPVKRFIIGTIASISFTVIIISLLLKLFSWMLDFSFGDSVMRSIYLSIFITVFISLFLHSRMFLISWRKAIVDGEELKKESIVAKYESLKSQVNPHFLFNSLNALTNLVYEDQDKAVKFIKQLSEVYRYVLDTRDRELVTIEEELAFLNSYLFLQKIRFGENLKWTVNIPAADAHIAPLALQMLIENAIKHNIVSTDDPLTINLFQEGDFIHVENNLQKKSTIGEPSPGLGLENICKRYEFLSARKVEIVKSVDKFLVKLPLIYNGQA